MTALHDKGFDAAEPDEYELPTSEFRMNSRRLGLSSLEKKYEPGARRKAC